jgi:hypothetical protein
LNILEKQIQTVARKGSTMYDEIEVHVADQTTSERSAASQVKNVKKVAQQTAKKEDEIVKIVNETSRVRGVIDMGNLILIGYLRDIN